MDVPRLIAEIYKRTPLWSVRDGFNKARLSLPKLWQEVSQEVGIDVELCKRKWKNLRDAYRAEVKRSERRIEKDKLMGQYDPNFNYNSKWVYFSKLRFIDDNKRNISYAIDNEDVNSNLNEQINQNDEEDNDSMYDDHFHNTYDIKLEPSCHIGEELHHNLTNDFTAEEDNECVNDILFEEFESVDTPQTTTFAKNILQQQNFSLPQSQHHHQELNIKRTTLNSHSCKCSQRTDDQVHFLKDLCRDERSLIKSTQQDVTRSNKLDHVGDSDYNFLVSFLPQMKKMSELQNLQFRSRMCEMVLNILTPSSDTQCNR